MKNKNNNKKTLALLMLLYEAIVYIFMSAVFGFGVLTILVLNGISILPSIFISLFGSAHMMLFMVGLLGQSIQRFKKKYGDI